MKPSVINSNNNSSNDEDSIADGLRQEEAEFGPFKVRYITKKFSTEETFYRRKWQNTAPIFSAFYRARTGTRWRTGPSSSVLTGTRSPTRPGSMTTGPAWPSCLKWQGCWRRRRYRRESRPVLFQTIPSSSLPLIRKSPDRLEVFRYGWPRGNVINKL